jgi:ribonuclease R
LKNNIREKILKLIEKENLIQKQIYAEMEAITKDEKKEVRKELKTLLTEMVVIKDSRNRYHLNNSNIIKGIIEFTKSGNLAFITLQNGEEIAIMPENSSNAMHKDLVVIEKIGKWRDIDKGKVVKILERNIKKVVGEFQKKKMFGFVIPLNGKINYDFYIPPEKIKGVKPGQIVEVEITKYPGGSKNPEGKIISILGRADDPKIDLPIVLSKHNLPEPGEYPSNIMKEAKKIPKFISPEEIKNRKDFRKETIFTIDGESAKDFDDAISINKLSNGNYELGVHIADVSHYIKENSNLDREAYDRGTSVYLIDKVIAMLPHEISDWICSLVEGEDRLTMSLIMEINPEGDVVNSEIYNGVIKSVKRLTYTKVNHMIDETADENLKKELNFLMPKFNLMKELMTILRENRKRRGAILDIESGEVYFEFDDKGRVKDILSIQRGISEKMIEEFMIKANETVASFFDAQELPFLYRTHDNPDPDTLLQLRNYLSVLGIKMKTTQNIHSKYIQEILEKTKDHPLKDSVQKLLVRSMQRAMYSDSNIGHFGLASESYTHFTSPIRRYPDLIVHRLLKLYIKNKGTLLKEEIEKYSNLLPEIASSCSKRERVSNEAEWDFRDMKKVEYISKYIGKVYEVVITGVTKFGLFVEISDKMINGLIHISVLNDYFIYNEKDNSLIGERTRKKYKIGDKIKAKVVDADKIKIQIDFEVYEK